MTKVNVLMMSPLAFKVTEGCEIKDVDNLDA